MYDKLAIPPLITPAIKPNIVQLLWFLNGQFKGYIAWGRGGNII
ncbi:hypothetical protein ACFQZS_18015 [Mucilaginibacter calamicampi]|uniref:Uncharacterized protein n=1 Tax=Mucilaginibacter calamicampi TaxID=1302352 RepID=A0ABW2Z5L8_9SPHI